MAAGGVAADLVQSSVQLFTTDRTLFCFTLTLRGNGGGGGGGGR